MTSSVDLTHYGVSRAKDWVSVDCGTNTFCITVNVANLFISFDIEELYRRDLHVLKLYSVPPVPNYGNM